MKLDPETDESGKIKSGEIQSIKNEFLRNQLDPENVEVSQAESESVKQMETLIAGMRITRQKLKHYKQILDKIQSIESEFLRDERRDELGLENLKVSQAETEILTAVMRIIEPKFKQNQPKLDQIPSIESEFLRNQIAPEDDISIEVSQAESESVNEMKTLKAGRRIKTVQVGSSDPDQHNTEEVVKEESKQMQPEKMSSEVARKRGNRRREKSRAGLPSVGCTNSDCSKIGIQRCAGCHWALYCGEVCFHKDENMLRS